MAASLPALYLLPAAQPESFQAEQRGYLSSPAHQAFCVFNDLLYFNFLQYNIFSLHCFIESLFLRSLYLKIIFFFGLVLRLVLFFHHYRSQFFVFGHLSLNSRSSIFSFFRSIEGSFILSRYCVQIYLSLMMIWFWPRSTFFSFPI